MQQLSVRSVHNRAHTHDVTSQHVALHPRCLPTMTLTWWYCLKLPCSCCGIHAAKMSSSRCQSGRAYRASQALPACCCCADTRPAAVDSARMRSCCSGRGKYCSTWPQQQQEG
jgi:hypothetical protein